MATPIPYYLDPRLARENLTASRLLNMARRVRAQRQQRRAEQIKRDTAQLVRLGWDADAAQEMAKAKARMEVAE